MADPAIRPNVVSVSFFPGCSLASSSYEAYDAMRRACGFFGLEIQELADWNCCGSSSAHSLSHELGLALPARNLSLAPSGQPLMAACPSCHKNLRSAHLQLKRDEQTRRRLQQSLGRSIDPGLNIVSFLEVLDYLRQLPAWQAMQNPNDGPRLGGLKAAPYYGCMLAAPKELEQQRYAGILEGALSALGAEPVFWNFHRRCCGTFLSATRPRVATEVVNRIMGGAMSQGADCIVTACAMCQLNLELRSSVNGPIPVLHFAEVLALALGAGRPGDWFKRHLIDPRPLLKSKGLI
jgi:heterodisulfide reductase subunit B